LARPPLLRSGLRGSPRLRQTRLRARRVDNMPARYLSLGVRYYRRQRRSDAPQALHRPSSKKTRPSG